MLNHPVLAGKDKITLKNQNNGEEMFNLLTKTYEAPVSFDYQVIYVTREFIARPDLLSLQIYGDTDYSDVLCKLNGISNPFELNEGMYIVAPSASRIQEFYNVINSEESTATVSDSNAYSDLKSLQKKKNETRKANEQVVGDKNFRIDKNNKIIIY